LFKNRGAKIETIFQLPKVLNILLLIFFSSVSRNFGEGEFSLPNTGWKRYRNRHDGKLLALVHSMLFFGHTHPYRMACSGGDTQAESIKDYPI